MNLQAAIDAVRDESLERGTAELMTRRRVLASVERSPSRRLHVVVAAVIASMFGASAFAWYARTPEPAAAPEIVGEANAIAAVEPIAAPARVAVHVEVATIDTVEPTHIEPTVARVGMTDKAIAKSEPAPDPELALYATAHRLHFQDRNLLAAADAWDRYLAVAPAGKLAPEARFNRLVALVRLERWDDAARALATFDDAAYRPADIAKLRSLVEARRPR